MARHHLLCIELNEDQEDYKTLAEMIDYTLPLIEI